MTNTKLYANAAVSRSYWINLLLSGNLLYLIENKTKLSPFFSRIAKWNHSKVREELCSVQEVK